MHKLLNLVTITFILIPALILISCGTTAVDYDTVFPSDKVNRIDIKISVQNWQKMLDEMEDTFGEFGQGEGKDRDEFWDVYWPSIDFPEQDPIFVPCTVTFNGRTWNHVGVRFKGVSTLARAWWVGSYKIPFKLDFDQFEGDHPETANQRFYGFKKISFANSVTDDSLLVYKVAADLFRESGVPTPRTAFYRVFFDTGNGPVYFGLYTAAEIPGKAMFVTWFNASGGNLFKPGGESSLAWAQDLPVDSTTFPRKNNITSDDFTEIQNAVDALNGDRTDSEAWRSNFEATFGVYGFINWLAVNISIQLSDVAGNAYLYAHPTEGGRIYWIPWDFDAAFPDYDISGHIDDFFGNPITLDMSQITDTCPLVRYVLDDPVYWEKYIDEIRAFYEGPFALTPMLERLKKERDLIMPYVIGEDGELAEHTYTNATEFNEAYDDLVDYVQQRHDEIKTFLGD